MAEWKEYAVADVISTVIDYRGKTPKKLGGDWSNSGYRALSAKNIKTGKIVQSDSIRYVSEDMYRCWMKEEVQKEDILITSEAPYGQIYYWNSDEKIVLSQRLYAVRINQQFYPKYVYFYMTSSFFQAELDGRATGTTVVGLRQPELLKCKIFAPGFQEQKRIADTLWCLEQKINNNEAINNNLEQQVSALYKSWFEDFEITNSVCPENWSYQELSTIADIASGKRPPIKSNICNDETPIYLVGAASVMGFTSEANHTDKILVTGRVGTHGVIQRFNTPCWTSDNTLVITSPYYEFTNQILHRIDYSSMNRGSTQPLITQGDMKKVVVLVPDEHTLAKFEEFAGSLMAKWEENNKENIKLTSLRDTLLPKLMSGELDVSDIDL